MVHRLYNLYEKNSLKIERVVAAGNGEMNNLIKISFK